MSASAPTELPTGYLLQNCRRVLTWVRQLYEDLLTEPERQFLQDFDTLSTDAQSLYVRLLTRKGPLLAIDSLNYPEVAAKNSALEALCAAGFATLNPQAGAESLLALLTKPELLTWFADKAAARLPRTELVQQIGTHTPLAVIHQTLSRQRPFVRAEHSDIFATCLLLFFGNNRQDLSEFVITDLGHVRYENYALSRQTRRFNHRAEIDILRQYFAIDDQLQDEQLLQDSNQLIALQQQLPFHQNLPELQRRHERIALSIARQLERLDQHNSALDIYRTCQQHPSRERQARILAKQGDLLAALELCHAILDNSHHPEEREFAEKFGATLARKHKLPFSDSAANADDIDTFHLQLPWQDEPVELLAARALSDAQHTCLYVENSLFCSLFGLYCWDIVFTPLPGAYFHPFQTGPHNLRSEFFYADRREQLDQRFADMDQPGWQERLWHHFLHKQGIANPFVFWDWLTPELIKLTLRAIPAAHLQAVFRQLCLHPGLYASGFPDLIRFAFDTHATPRYELIEVKGPGDRLQANQRRWFRHFHQAGIPARLLNVSWQETGE